MNEQEFINQLKQQGIELTALQIEQFKKYYELLVEWNQKMNLTAITDENDIILKHFIDSLSIIKYLKDNKSIIDIGSGAGFPGIPIKILEKDIEMTLMDSLNKRVIFLNEVIEKLKLQNIVAIHSRAEDLARDVNYREKYDIAVSRAVANLSTLSEYMLPFVKVGGKCICMKGANIEEEKNLAENAIMKLGGKIISVENFKLANSDNERNIIIIEKVNKTDTKYPRKAGVPGKDPLK